MRAFWEVCANDALEACGSNERVDMGVREGGPQVRSLETAASAMERRAGSSGPSMSVKEVLAETGGATSRGAESYKEMQS